MLNHFPLIHAPHAADHGGMNIQTTLHKRNIYTTRCFELSADVGTVA
ncbi:TPA: hypothetical protein N2D24_002724 [Pseudomonas aeruginosa]|nr:hypothetical protein [Pseudomonas aeruginosa]